MALIVKCKCGQQMKVATALAGKKLSCPGCKKSFRIPPEKFKAPAGQPQAAPPKPALKPAPVPAVKPPTSRPPPAIELDITPSELDLLSGFDHAPSGILGDVTDFLSAPVCPSCSGALPPDAKICVNCGFDLRTGKHIAGEGDTALRPHDVGYARDEETVRAKPSHRDAILGPTRSYWADAASAFIYPFQNGGNIVTFVIIMVVAMLGAWLRMLSSYGILFLSGPFIVFGYLASLYLSIVRDTASGFVELPGIKIEDGFVDDIVKPAFKYVGAFACAIAPSALYLIAANLGVIPDSILSGWAFVLWLALGISLLPLFIMFFAFDALSMLWRVDLMLTTIFRTFFSYLCLCLLLMIVNFDAVLGAAGGFFSGAGIDIKLPKLPNLGAAGIFVYDALGVYLNIVAMRQIGLFYLHYKKRFTLIFE